MLVLSRKKGETIVIAGDIRVTIIEVRGNQVKIGVAAPSDVTVDRAEVHNRRASFAPASETVAA